MDAMRVELVQQLGQYFRYVDSAWQRIREFTFGRSSKAHNKNSNKIEATSTRDSNSDMEVVDKFEQGILVNKTQPAIRIVPKASSRQYRNRDSTNAVVVTGEEIEENKQSQRQFRECLPQLVSAVLKSPMPFEANLVDPVHKLRELIISRCQQDPSWGIELCWLLEAEVGRTWKSLFEHRQQTGKRLIVVLPADKAAVIAKIGIEKQAAFDLLQDAERVTAYGYSSDDAMPKLPSSISLLRCSHFGDTMHFVDRLTKISLDLRMVPTIQRHAHLLESLYEMNRRLRRRMVTRGEISLDVKDNLGPYDWPQLNDVTVDTLKHSVHFPLIPNQGTWPSGTLGESEGEPQGGVMQILNIVVPESRILASRERCPYLVRLELVETGLDGGDARLYAAGAPKLGLTVEEALTMESSSGFTNTKRRGSNHQHCEIPTELVDADPGQTVANDMSSAGSHVPPRGGGTDFMGANTYDVVREQEYEQLHQHMQDAPHVAPQPAQVVNVDRPALTEGEDLLDRIFGQPWKEVCDDVRRTSPYGHVKGWRLASFILKAGEDIRREALVMQMISRFNDWFEAEIPEENRPYLRPYTIMCVGGDAGLLECLTDAKSIDEVKKTSDGFVSLRDYFIRAYGQPQRPRPLQPPMEGQPQPQQHPMGTNPQQRGYSPQHQPPIIQPRSNTSRPTELTFEQAQDNFLRSLVGYSLVCYILQIKDRHNANIMMDREGHIVHIDFGFVLGDTPRMGKVPIFSERAPFKLSGEFWDVLGGWNVKSGGLGVRFCKMFEEAFTCASNHSDELASLVEGIMLTLTDDAATARLSANRVRARLRMRGPPGSFPQKMFIMDLINTALTSWGTSTYDWLQKNMNGYQ